VKKIFKIMKKNYIYGIAALLIIIISVLGILLYRKNNEYSIQVNNQYNLAFYELIDYVQDIETYLAKAAISNSPESGTETLTNVWKEANLASVYLSQLPTSSGDLSKTAKFLNQVSDYAYSLSRKNINNEPLSQDDLNNIKELHDYSAELKTTLIQLASDMQSGRVTWRELTKDTKIPFAQQVDNLSATVFGNIDQNFGEYQGLIYDGAFSDNTDKAVKVGLTGDDIDENTAKQIASNFIGQDKIKEITLNGEANNGDIPSYDFSAKMKNGDDQNPLSISISKKGGHVILMNYNREVAAEVIVAADADKIAQEFLTSHGFTGMKSTYYLTQGGVITINYAYVQDSVTIYPDLIKVKVALDNGEILGIECAAYLNCHTVRSVPAPAISADDAKKTLNKNLEITSEGLAIIPTKWNTEIFCYEFKGKIDNTDFLVYINAVTGKEENVLLITNTPNGILTQ